MNTQSKNYSEIKAVSNSILTEFEFNRKNFRNWWKFDKPFPKKDTMSLSLGSIVDTYLTRPTDFDKMFFVAEGVEITPQMKTFCDNLLKAVVADKTPIKDSTLMEKLMLKAYEDTKFKRDTFENVKKRFKAEGMSYFKIALKANNRDVITEDMNTKAKELVKETRANEFVNGIFAVKSEDLVPGVPLVSVFDQLEIVGIYTSEEGGCNLPIKGALDKVMVDHTAKIVYPYDIKTSIKLNNFIESYNEYRYFRQASYYTWLLKKWLIEKGWNNYKIEPFRFIVLSTMFEGAYIYEVSEKDLELSETGGLLITGETVKGWRQLLDEICWHIKNDKWDYPVDVYKNQGIRKLELFV